MEDVGTFAPPVAVAMAFASAQAVQGRPVTLSRRAVLVAAAFALQCLEAAVIVQMGQPRVQACLTALAMRIVLLVSFAQLVRVVRETCASHRTMPVKTEMLRRCCLRRGEGCRARQSGDGKDMEVTQERTLNILDNELFLLRVPSTCSFLLTSSIDRNISEF